MPKLASQIRTAFSSMAWKTGSSSPGDELMTLSTSEKRQLLIRERIYFSSSKLDCSDRHSLTQEWNTSCRPVSKPSREGASFGKFVSLRLEVNYMNRLSIDNGAARNTSTRARETDAEIGRNWTLVGG